MSRGLYALATCLLGATALWVPRRATAQVAPAARCGVPISVARFSSIFRVELDPIGRGLTIATWLESRGGVSDVYFALIGDSGRPVGSIGGNGSIVPHAAGAVLQFEVARTAVDEMAVGVVTSRAGATVASFTCLRVEATAGDTSITATCDSSLVVAGDAELVKLLPLRDHEVIGVLGDPSRSDRSIVLRVVTLDGNQSAAGSPEFALATDPPGMVPLDAATDGAGGGFVLAGSPAVSGSLAATDELPRLIHWLSDGRLDPRWPTKGRVLGGGLTSVQLPVIAGDGEGGIYAAWGRTLAADDTLRAVAVRLDASGSYVPGWDSTGTALVADGADFQFEPRLSVGRGGRLYAVVNEISRRSVGALDGSGRTAAGWPREGYTLHPHGFIVDVVDAVATPVAEGACLVSWSVKDDSETLGYDLYSAVLPLPPGEFPYRPPHRVTVCATETDQLIAAAAAEMGRARFLWTDEFPADPLNDQDGLYAGEMPWDGLRPVEPQLQLVSGTRHGDHVSCVWRSANVLDDLPQVRVTSAGGDSASVASVTRLDSWSVTADVLVGGRCPSARVELVVPGANGSWTSVAPALDLDCFPQAPLRIAFVTQPSSGALEVHLVSDGATGAARLTLFDLLGRRCASRSVSLEADGESVEVLPAPRAQGVYWLVATSGANRATRRVVLTR